MPGRHQLQHLIVASQGGPVERGQERHQHIQLNQTTPAAVGNETTGWWYTDFYVIDDSGLGPDQYLTPPVFTGPWRTSTFSGWSGGTTHKTTAAGATASIQVFGGNVVAVVMAMGPDRGTADIRVNGATVRTVNTYSVTRQNRVVVANILTPAGNAVNTVSVVNRATAGHPRIDVDAFLTVSTP